MKKVVVAFFLGVFLTVLIGLLFRRDHKIQETIAPGPRKGVAVIMTGAAARIPQEAALLEELDKRGLLKNLVFISGVSSGALNAVMLNGILTKKITWKDYREILYSLKNNDLFIQDGKKIPVNTLPARDLYKRVIENKLGYQAIGDLPITTEISFTNLNKLKLKKTVYRICSRKINEETDTTLNLVDILMASSAFPIIFPPVRIKNATSIPDVDYIDGGIGDDQVPFHSLFEFEKHRGIGVEKVYIISRKRDNIPEISEELKGLGIDDKGMIDKIGFSFDAILDKGIIKKLEEYASQAPELIPRTFVWRPDFKEDFLLFNFDNLKEQYVLTSQWAKTHNPIPLGDYLLPYLVN